MLMINAKGLLDRAPLVLFASCHHSSLYTCTHLRTYKKAPSYPPETVANVKSIFAMHNKIPIPSFSSPAALKSDDGISNRNNNNNRKQETRRSKRSRPQASSSSSSIADTPTDTPTPPLESVESFESSMPQAKRQNRGADVPIENGSSVSFNYLSSILKIETGIQLQTRRNNNKNKMSISLDKFIHLISKATGQGGNATKSMAEKLAIVYIATASPELVKYNYNFGDDSCSSGGGVGDGDSSSGRGGGGGDQNRQYYLTFFEANDDDDDGSKVMVNNRMEELSKLYKSKWNGWENDMVKKLSEQITNRHRTRDASAGAGAGSKPSSAGGSSDASSTRTVAPSSSAAAPSESKNKAIIIPGMTLEDRIRAREQQRQRIVDETENGNGQKRKTDGSGNGNGNVHLIFADALNLYLRHAYSRSIRFRKSSAASASASSSASSKVQVVPPSKPMPLNEVCNHLSSAPQSGGNRYSKKEVKRILHELVGLVPEWIQIVSGSTKNKGGSGGTRSGSGGNIKRGDMVVVKSGASYQVVREKLGGRVVRSVKAEAKEMHDEKLEEVKSKSNPKPSSNSSSNSNSGQMDGKGTEAVQRGGGSNKRSTGELVQMAKKHGSKLSLSRNRNGNAPTRIVQPSMPPPHLHSHSHSYSYSSTAEPIAPVPNGGGNELRVNYNQHMTDVDYDGGLVLQSNSTNPRGLKRMFSQLNAGERI